MSTAMPVLETQRLTIRPFVEEELHEVHRVLSSAWGVPEEAREAGLAVRERWLRWAAINPEGLASVSQPPYGDRAVALRETGRLIGSVGVVPCIGPFGQLPGFPGHQGSRFWYPEVGLFWAIDPAHQGRGYAPEAARALIDFMFDTFHLGRIIATTENHNDRSMAVMRKLGMELLRNPEPEPVWFQVVGVLNRISD